MGLLQRKKLAIERKLKNKKNPIVCLYCFKSFAEDRVMFRALESIDAQGYRAEYDILLDEYRAKFHLESKEEMPVVLDPDYFKEVNKGYHLGVLSSLTDDYNNITTKRVCPYCHNDISKTAGVSPLNIVSIVGARGTGKTTFMTSLIHILKSVTSHHFNIFCTPLNSEIGKKFKTQFEQPLVQNGKLSIDAMSVNEPIVFTITFSDTLTEIHIVCFELFDHTHEEIYSSLLRNSKGLIFLVDPTKLRGISSRFDIVDMDIVKEVFEDQSDALIDLTYSITSEDIPLAVVLSKSDMLNTLKGDILNSDSVFFENKIHKGQFDIIDFEKLHYECDAFLFKADPNLRNAIRTNFGNIGFFACSSMGASSEDIAARKEDFAPRRVDEPLLWIMYQLGLI